MSDEQKMRHAQSLRATTRACFKTVPEGLGVFPQGLKPNSSPRLFGTAESRALIQGKFHQHFRTCYSVFQQPLKPDSVGSGRRG